MGDNNVHLVTGGLGYVGKYIVSELLEKGCNVRTITNSPNRPNPFGNKLDVYQYNFDDMVKLAKNFENVKVLYNTFWIRFEHGDKTFEWALENSRKLVNAAVKSGVERVVHISVLNSDSNSDLKYYRYKGLCEDMIKKSGIEYSILKPAIVFGHEDVLINNIAWSLRHLPVMGIFGKGDYRIRPIHVEDLANLAVIEGGNTGKVEIEAVGLDNIQFKEMVKTIKDEIGSKTLVMPVPIFMGYLVTKFIGLILRDKFLTMDEVKALIRGKLSSKVSAVGRISLREWIKGNVDWLGKGYKSELARRRDRTAGY